MSILDIAQSRKGKLRDGYSASKAGVSVADTRVEYGTAVGDSSDGYVTVRMDNAPTDGTADFSVPCDAPITQGDRVSYISTKGKGKAVSVGTLAQIAQDAEDIATATNQYFWHDTNGIHVSTDAEDPAGTRNILINALGILLRKLANTLVSISETAVAFFDGSGNQTASFGTTGAVIGLSGESHFEVDYHSMRLVDMNGNVYFLAEDLRDADGKAHFTDTFTGTGVLQLFDTSIAFDGIDSIEIDGVEQPSSSYTTPDSNTVRFNTAPANGAVIEIAYYSESDDMKAYTAGIRKPSSQCGPLSFAEGYDNEASGYCSHAEGEGTLAGYIAHAEGKGCEALGEDSHAEGRLTTAYGPRSHAQNLGTYAQGYDQTAIGTYNVGDTTSALIIGNGAHKDARSNALTVDWSGNVVAAGDITDGNGTAISDLAIDYIVEAGDSGIWYYRKWNGGKAECWCKASKTITGWSSWGSLYESTPAIQVSYPSGLFLNPPRLFASQNNGGAGLCGIEMYNAGTASQTPEMYLLRPTAGSTNTTFYIDLYAMGAWK